MISYYPSRSNYDTVFYDLHISNIFSFIIVYCLLIVFTLFFKWHLLSYILMRIVVNINKIYNKNKFNKYLLVLI